MTIKVSASIMAKGFTQKSVDLAQCADRIHIDIMDGKFVNDTTINAEDAMKLQSHIPKDVHLMVERPEEYVKEFAGTDVERISFHIEASANPERLIKKIISVGKKAGIAIDSYTNPEKAFHVLEATDFVIVMSVKAGKGGQGFLEESLDKIKAIKSKFPDMIIEVDGGINSETGRKAAEAGADVLISGSFLFKGDVKKNIEMLRRI